MMGTTFDLLKPAYVLGVDNGVTPTLTEIGLVPFGNTLVYSPTLGAKTIKVNNDIIRGVQLDTAALLDAYIGNAANRRHLVLLISEDSKLVTQCLPFDPLTILLK